MMKLKEIYTKGLCPVCGYKMFDREEIYPWGEDGESQSDEICPCCGIQFGYQDLTLEYLWKNDDMHKRLNVYHEWRENWVRNGMKYKHYDDEFYPQPLDYNPIVQLKNIGIVINEDGTVKNS